MCEELVRTIFILDDDPAQTEMLAAALSSSHTRVFGFSDPLRALAALHVHRADLLITDLSLPWVDGRYVLHSARDYQPHLKVLLMSGHPRAAEIAACEHIGCVIKPIHLDGLLRAVEETLTGCFPSPALRGNDPTHAAQDRLPDQP